MATLTLWKNWGKKTYVTHVVVPKQIEQKRRDFRGCHLILNVRPVRRAPTVIALKLLGNDQWKRQELHYLLLSLQRIITYITIKSVGLA